MKPDSKVHDEAGVLAGIVPSVNLAAEPGRMSDAVIFIYSDRVVQEKLDFWREEKAGA